MHVDIITSPATGAATVNLPANTQRHGLGQVASFRCQSLSLSNLTGPFCVQLLYLDRSGSPSRPESSQSIVVGDSTEHDFGSAQSLDLLATNIRQPFCRVVLEEQ